MKRVFLVFMMLAMVLTMGFTVGSNESSADSKDTEIVASQQAIYQAALPVPLYDYSIPRDVFIQIYDVVTTKAYVTYSVIASMTGVTIFHGPSIGYAIPADTSLTNPLRAEWRYSSGAAGVTIEQPEPNGLFSSKNTDGTWVLFLNDDGTVTPIYTEMKVTTFPFAVIQSEDGSWIRADSQRSEFTVEVGQ